jgi:hypothetical protein
VVVCVLWLRAGARTVFFGGTSPYWVSPESSCFDQDDSCVVRCTEAETKR